MSRATTYKVQVKLGQAEFSAEGPEDTVKEPLLMVRKVISSAMGDPKSAK